MNWIDVKDALPTEIGRYLVLQTFIDPCVCNEKIVRKHIAFTSNFSPDSGWKNCQEIAEVTHWMEIPAPPED